MSKTITIAIAIALCVLSAPSANAASMVISAFATNTTNLDGNLVGFTTGAGDFNIDEIASATGPNENSIVFSLGSTPPANSTDALSDQRIDTGQLSVGQNTIFSVTGPLSAADSLFVFFNGGGGNFFQGPGTITAVDGGGAALGTAVVNVDNNATVAGTDPADTIAEGDALLLYSADRIGSTVLNNRILAGVTVDIADFNVADPSTIAGFQIAGEVALNAFLGSFDVNAVGIASPVVPEPATASLLSLTFIGLVTRRRR